MNNIKYNGYSIRDPEIYKELKESFENKTVEEKNNILNKSRIKYMNLMFLLNEPKLSR